MFDTIEDDDEDVFTSKTPQVAPLGRVGCDPPLALVDYIMRDAAERSKNDPFDFLFFPGDFVAHHIAQEPDDHSAEKYALLKKTHAVIQNVTNTYFPNTPAFIQFGNNDCKIHNSAPFPEEKVEYYNFMFDLWFKDHKGNQKFADQVESTFKNGGYYRVDLADKVSLLSINSLQYNKDQYSQGLGPEFEDQKNWLFSELDNTKDGTKFLLLDHIYAGARIKHSDLQVA